MFPTFARRSPAVASAVLVAACAPAASARAPRLPLLPPAASAAVAAPPAPRVDTPPVGVTDADRLAGIEWRFHAGSTIAAPPVVAPDGTTCVGTGDGSLQAVSPEGVLVWSYTLDGAVSSAVVDDANRVYLATTAQRLYGFLTSGVRAWQLRPPARVATELVPAAAWGLVFGGADGSVWTVSTRGTALWHVDLHAAITAAPAVAGNRIVVGTAGGDGVFFDGAVKKFVAHLGQGIRQAPLVFPDGSAAVLAGSTLFRLDARAAVTWQLDGVALVAAGRAGLLAVDASGTLLRLAEDGHVATRTTLGAALSEPPVEGPGGEVYASTECGDLLVVSADGRVRTVPVARSPLHRPFLDGRRNRIVVAAGSGMVAAVRL